MATSVFDLFKIGIGPSSSHTVGPMKAAGLFLQHLPLRKVNRIQVDLYGSLGLTGMGHGSDKAVLLGLEGELPETVEIAGIPDRLQHIEKQQIIHLNQQHPISFHKKQNLIFHRQQNLPLHENGLRFRAWDPDGQLLVEKTYYSIGGGFVLEGEGDALVVMEDQTELPFPFKKASELLEICRKQQCSMSQIVLTNERIWHSTEEIYRRLLEIWLVMQECVRLGCVNEGVLPGGLKVKRRAPSLHRKLQQEEDPTNLMVWVNLFALAVNEENAAGGRVVTAPTNGAAGIIPAVLHYLMRFTRYYSEAQVVRFLLTAAGIGMLYKENASISGAAVGCQGEVGSACSMAAGALAECLGGTPAQVENAAEIAMEHNLGLTCDPIGGLVQIPCIERNAIAANKAINAAQLALRTDGQHHVSLDKVIRTMWQTGRDMDSKYKETARGGLAVNIVEC
ncbi:MAG: L-serine ammonia-lyase [SAR324 cluster bacterium]|nr:L-serine ammonia-lyase [SAR324 cluster bacterium]